MKTSPSSSIQDPMAQPLGNPGALRAWKLPTSVLLAAMAIMASRAVATDFYWSGQSASSDNIDQDDNWWNNSHPSSGDNLYFNNTAGPRHGPYSNYGPGSWFDSIITQNGAGGIQWRGDATYALKFENNNDANLLEIVANIGNRAGEDLEINPVGTGGIKVDNAVTITDGNQIKVYGTNTLAFAGAISGSSATLAILEGATAVFNAVATFTGDIYVNNGTLRLSVNNALANSGNFLRLGDTTGAASAHLSLDGGFGLSIPINVRAGNSGVMIIGNTASTVRGATFSGNLYLDHDVTLYANSSGSNVLAGAILDLKDQTLTADGAGTNYITGVLQQSVGQGKLTKNGAGKLFLAGSANNGYSGLTTVNAGTLSLGMTTAGLNAFGGDLTINGGTVNYSSSIDNQIPDIANVTINAAGTLDFDGRNETIGRTGSSPAGSFTVNGGYVTIERGTVKLGGTPSMNGGKVLVWGPGALETDQELVLNGGTIDFSLTTQVASLNLRGGDGTGITCRSSSTATALISNSGGHGQISLNADATTVFTVEDAPTLATELQINVPMVYSGTTSAIRKEGAGRLLLTGDGTHSPASIYTGATTINGGTLALGIGASINYSANISIAAGATFDVSAISPYTLSSSTSLSASGTGTTAGSTAAVIKGAPGGSVNLGSRPISLTCAPTSFAGDSAHPALFVSQGALSLNGNSFTVNNASGTALGYGTYTLIQQASGNITSAGSYSVSVTGDGRAANSTALISVSGGTVLLTIAGTAPTQLTMSGTGSFCTSAGSQTFGVSGATETDVTYALKNGPTTVDSKVGIGGAITFAAQSAAGTYTVVGTRGSSAVTMSGSATINASPVAPSPNVSSNVAPNLSLKISISELLTAWTGSSLSLQSAGPASTAGGTVTKDSTYIYYLPPGGTVAADHIPYAVSSASGCSTSAYIDLAIAVPGGIAQTITVSGGTATINFYGIPGFQYDVQRATSLGPPANWTTITTGSPLTASLDDGSFSYTDDSAPDGTAYYRSMQH